MGLYYYKEEEKGYTHVLFMDDDASCETEAIYRSYRFLNFAKMDDLAIVGSMLLGNRPNIQWESGADFNEVCRPKKSGFNLHDRWFVVENENGEFFDYGGWWFFLFPIKDAEYPFPFFVRGDDVNFGLQRQFTQITLNGIATWGDDFGYKESPFTYYLDARAHLLHHLQVSTLSHSYIVLLRTFWRLFLKYGLTYRYASAKSQIEALKDVLKGPKFWEENIDMREIFPKILPLAQEEKLSQVDDGLNMMRFDSYESFHLPQKHLLYRVLKVFTLNGHLVPIIFFKKRGMIIDKTDHRFGMFFLRKEIYVYHKESNEGFILYHDKRRFFS
jgi:hypothetical protein